MSFFFDNFTFLFSFEFEYTSSFHSLMIQLKKTSQKKECVVSKNQENKDKNNIQRLEMKWGSIETMFWGVSIFERDVGSSEHSNHFEFRTCWINTLTKERICKTILLLVCFNGTELNTSAGPQNLIPKVTTQRNIYTQQKTKVRRKKESESGREMFTNISCNIVYCQIFSSKVRFTIHSTLPQFLQLFAFGPKPLFKVLTYIIQINIFNINLLFKFYIWYSIWIFFCHLWKNWIHEPFSTTISEITLSFIINWHCTTRIFVILFTFDVSACVDHRSRFITQRTNSKIQILCINNQKGKRQQYNETNS